MIQTVLVFLWHSCSMVSIYIHVYGDFSVSNQIWMYLWSRQAIKLEDIGRRERWVLVGWLSQDILYMNDYISGVQLRYAEGTG